MRCEGIIHPPSRRMVRGMTILLNIFGRSQFPMGSVPCPEFGLENCRRPCCMKDKAKSTYCHKRHVSNYIRVKIDD